jgi:hypothetical protein
MTPPTLERWRALALYLTLFGMVGTFAELLLLGHFEGRPQWVPLVCLAAGCLVAVWTAVRPTRRSVHALRGAMAAFLPAGVLGIFFHLKSNVEFELEMRPSLAGSDLAIEALQGAMPALAPGTLLQLGLLGLLVTYRHPALGADADSRPDS